MFSRLFCAAFAATALVAVPMTAAAPTTAAPTAKEALQAFNEFIGDWKGDGGPANKPRPAPNELWKEGINWGWKFKGDDVWISMTFKDGKYFKSGEVRYVPEKKNYKVTLTDMSDKKIDFVGEFKKDVLTLERTDAEKKEVQQLTMNTAAEGVRFIYRSARKKEGSTIYVNEYLVQATREGESLGAKAKKIECVVSGGLGTMPVTFKGETFYVCCSGCKDAFNENAEKYVKEFKAKKK